MPSSRRSNVISAVLIAVIATLSAAAAAGAAVIASTRSQYEGGPALAADGRVIVGERRGNGALRILAIDPVTKAAVTLHAFPRLADPLSYSLLELSGGGGTVAATLHTWREATGVQSGPEQDIPERQAGRSLTILPAVAPLGSCGRPLSPSARLDAAGGDGFVATTGEECGVTSAAVRIRTATATFSIPAGPVPAGRVAHITALRANGPMVSWTEMESFGGDAALARWLVVARGTTGQVLLRVPLGDVDHPSAAGLGADGTVVTIGGLPPCALHVVSPAAPVRRTVVSPAQGPCPFASGQRSIGVAAGRAVFGANTGYAVSDLLGLVRPLGEGRRAAGAIASPVAFDGRLAHVVRSDCDADRLLAVDADAPAPALPAQGGSAACPVRRSGPALLLVAGDERVRIGLRCARGCRGTLRLVQQRRGGRERLVGEARLAHAAGAVSVRPRVAAYARAIAGCAGGLRVVAKLFRAGDIHVASRLSRPPSLGPYRLRSRSACRQAQGPAFRAPRPGPRP